MKMPLKFKPHSARGSTDAQREFEPETIRLIVGLGNPGARYAHTYHNAGRLVVRGLADVAEAKFEPSNRYRSHRGAHHTFIIPRAFMNESGAAVKTALRTLRIKPSELLLVHDDADLPLGSFRFARARGAAGHHGVESVMRALGTKAFWRLRVGIRPPAATRERADTFVLRQMPRAARAAIAAITGELEAILRTRQ